MEIGQIINNRYQAIAPLGTGGFADVWEINDLQEQKCKVLKILKQDKLQIYPEKEQKKIISLFQQEGKILHKLTHPGIPKGYDYFTITGNLNPLYCLVMEKITGENLQEWLEKHQQITDIKIAINWLKQLTEIIALIHQEKLIHRDIKPENIILKPDGTLVLIDFGSVRQITTTYLIKMGTNQSGTQILSPLYAAPEQFNGICFPQSDFFTLGKTFVHLLTGNPPVSFAKNTLKDEFQSLANLIDYMIQEYPGKRPQNTSIILEYLSAIEKDNKEVLNQTLLQIKNQQFWHYFVLIQYHKIFLNKTLITSVFVFVTLILSLFSPQIATALNDKGLESFEQKDYTSALWRYKLALFLNSKSVSTHYNLGLLYEEQKQIDLAKKEYQQAIDIDNFDDAYNNLARLEILAGNYTEARNLIQTTLKINPDSSNQTKHYLHKNLGWSQLKLGQISAAKKSLQTAIELNSNQAAPHCLMAQVLEAEKQSAQTEWQNCLKFSAPDNQEVSEWQKLAILKVKK